MTQEIMRELIEEEGLTEEVARLRLRDSDLWVLRPGARFDEDLQGEDGVRMWEEAARVARTVAGTISNGPGTIQASPAMTQLVWDAAERAEVALERARLRQWTETNATSEQDHPEMRNTVFGQVLAELLEARGREVTPFKVGKLAEEAGLDGWKVIGRMANAGAEDPGHLDGLGEALDLSLAEMVELPYAYTFERRA